MAITAIKDFKIKEAYTKLVEKALFSYLWEGIYKPMFEILALKPVVAKNSMNVIIEALRDGKLIYVDGGFKAKEKFTNAQSSQLLKWGAKWDRIKKMYRISVEMLPESLRIYLAEAEINNELKINQIQEYLRLVEENMPYIVDSMVFDTEVKTILDDAGNEVKQNVKKIAVIEPELSEQQKAEIARTYTENVRRYVIKDFANERIPEMRRKIQELVLQGYRMDKVQALLQKEYGFMAKKAKFLAQNETTIMLSEYKKVTYKKMGFNKFIWKTILDGKERPLHQALHNTVWSYDDPPIIDERTGVKGLPGQTYNCRCEQVPFSDDSPFSYHDVEDHSKKLFAKNATEDIDWITVKGNHIPIYAGQTKEEAVKEFIESKKDKQQTEQGEKTIAGVKRGKPMTRKQANEGRVNPNYSSGDKFYKQNCQACVAIFEARMKGYNVEIAKFDKETWEKLRSDPFLAYVDSKTGCAPKFVESHLSNERDCKKWLNEQIKLGERFAFGYAPRPSSIPIGHLIEVTRLENGKLSFYDPQDGKSYDETLLDEIGYEYILGETVIGFSPKIFRLDDKELNLEILNKIAQKAQD